MLTTGEIYCYSNKSFILPSLYYSYRRRTGSGIVLNEVGNIVRIISLVAHNEGSRYKFMDGDLRNTDFPNVNCTKYEATAYRDINGLSNTNHTASFCQFNEVTWNSYKYLKDTEYSSRLSNWYVPSLGEISILHKNLTEVLHSLELARLTSTSLYTMLNERPKLISSTQASSSEMYGIDLSNGKLIKIKKGALVHCISMNKLKEEGGFSV